MLEALEKIKSAEELNERKKEQLLAELTAYEASKKQLLQEKREELRADFSNEQELSRSAEDAIKQMEENYSSKKEQTIQKIIERVISEYGSQ